MRLGELVVEALGTSDALGGNAIPHEDDPVARAYQRLRPRPRRQQDDHSSHQDAHSSQTAYTVHASLLSLVLVHRKYISLPASYKNFARYASRALPGKVFRRTTRRRSFSAARNLQRWSTPP